MTADLPLIALADAEQVLAEIANALAAQWPPSTCFPQSFCFSAQDIARLWLLGVVAAPLQE